MEHNERLFGFRSPAEMLREYGVNEEISNILAAFSGGADSALMLYYLKKWCDGNAVKLFAAHVNHGIRGEEAIRDREHCRAFCERLGVELFILDADVPTLAKERKKGIEECAREVRYEFFAEIMAEKGIGVLATAHNADDNLETVIFRLARGSGADGLCGIPPVREVAGGYAVRPILSLTKEEIIAACKREGVEFVYDSTNSDTAYTRNSIRAEILPVLRRINPSVSRSVLRTAELLREDKAHFDRELDRFFGSGEGDSVSALGRLEDAMLKRALARLANNAGASSEYIHLGELLSFVREGREGAAVSLPGRVRATVRNGKIVFSEDKREKKKKRCEEAYEKELSMGDNLLPGGYLIRLGEGFSTESSQSTQQIHPNDENVYRLFTQAALQSDKINGKLFCGSRRAGERIRCGGMGKELRKLMSEAGLDVGKRDIFPVVRDEIGALWLPDIALRDGVKYKEDKNKASPCLYISVWRKI